MGKRKHQDDYDAIKKKLKKLEKKLKRSRKKHDSSSSSSDSHNSDASPTNLEDGSMVELESMYVDKEVNISELENNNNVCVHESDPGVSRSEHASPTPSTSRAALSPLSIEPQSTPKSGHTLAHSGREEPIENSLLELLGDDPSTTQSCGREIHNKLATRIEHIVTNGLSKDTRKELHNKYLPPSNCTVLDAPILNPEIKAAVSETVLKRDKGIEIKQKQLGGAISCLGQVISSLLEKENKDSELIKLLMDACRIICDCQNNDSVTRRNFVLYNLKKEMRDQLQKSRIDSALFGSDLAEKIKTAKSISKSGAELKSAPAPKLPSKFNKHTPVSTPQRNLNWKAPPQNRRPQKGTQEPKEPALRSQPTSSSRPSYRVPPQKNRSRR